MVLSLLTQTYCILLCEASLPSICSKMGRHVTWDCIKLIPGTRMSKSYPCLHHHHLLQYYYPRSSFLDTGLAISTIPSLTHLSLGNISKLHFKEFSEFPRTSGYHLKKILPHGLHYSTHLLDVKGLLQKFEGIYCNGLRYQEYPHSSKLHLSRPLPWWVLHGWGYVLQ